MTFKDDLREVLDSLEPDGKRINGKDQAEAKITKLVEGVIGSDMGSTGYAIEEYGYNNTKQEIRQRLNSSNEQKEGK